MKKTIIVMPVANEETTMSSIIEEILSLPYDNLFLFPIIDHYSHDRTEEIIHEYEKKNKRIKCIFYEKSTGVVSCYLYGFEVALQNGAEWVIEMDGGGSHLPSEIPLFIDGLKEGYDCLWGSRFVKGAGLCNDPLYRRFLSKGGTLLANLVLGTNLKDMTSGFEAFNSNVLKQLKFSSFLSKGHIYQTEMRYYCRNFHAKEIPIHYTGGNSSLKIHSVKEAISVLFCLKDNDEKVWIR